MAIAILPGIIIFLIIENIYFRYKIFWRDEEIKKASRRTGEN